MYSQEYLLRQFIKQFIKYPEVIRLKNFSSLIPSCKYSITFSAINLFIILLIKQVGLEDQHQ